jgi:SNF2 family DNA or RNA helicase
MRSTEPQRNSRVLATQIGELSIVLEDDDTIVITPNEHVGLEDWRRTVLFWSLEIARPLATRELRVPMGSFMEKLSWFRDVWRNSGRSYNVSQELLNHARKYKDGSQAFKHLRNQDVNRFDLGEVRVPNLLATRTLTNRQKENILYLLDMENGSNFSVPGAGKTLTALCVWQILKSKNKLNKLLVVCPQSAFESWQNELFDSFGLSHVSEIYSGRLLADITEVCLVNYEQLENIQKLQYLKQWLSTNSGALVVDEAHRIKGGRNSVRWNSVRQLSLVAKRVDILTGTPMPQGPRDLQSLFSAAWPKLSRLDLDDRMLVNLPRNTVFVRTTKGELELPEATLVEIKEQPSPLQLEIIEALQDRYVGVNFLSISDAKNLAKRGKAVMSMLAAATNPGLLSVDKTFAKHEFGFAWPPFAVTNDKPLGNLIEEYLKHEIPWKFKYVALRAEELRKNGEKVLVWSNFIGNLASLKGILRKFEPAVVFGNVSGEERISEIQRFRSDPNCTVLLSNPQTLGEGVSLHQVCHNEIFVDRTYNAGLYLQAVDRIHRLGLPEGQKTNIEILISKGTIDERVAIRLGNKITALSNFLQDENLVTAAIPQSDEISPEHILGLSEEDFADIASHWKL